MTNKMTSLIVIALSAVLLAGCGSSSSTPTYGTSGSGATGRSAASIGTQSGHLVDANGFALYETANACAGGCLAVWPPLDASTAPTAGSGVNQGLISVASGQVTYNGHLLYYFESDTAAGQATGDGVGGFTLAAP
jgi:predicted lipoprotein with Yx(FWY)xxD motif